MGTLATGTIPSSGVSGSGFDAKRMGPGSSRILVLFDSLGVQHLRTGMYRTGSGIAGTSRWGASHDTPTGNGTMRFYASDRSFSWQAPGDTEGPRVSVSYPKTVRLYSGNGTMWFLLSILPDKVPVSDTSVTVTISYFNTTHYGSVPVVGCAQGHLETMLRALTYNGVEIINKSVGGLAMYQLESLVNGLLADPTEAANLKYIDRVFIQLGTNDMLGYGDPDPTTWMPELAAGIAAAQKIAPVTMIAPPMPKLTGTTLQTNAWKYLWKPLRATCRNAGARVVSIWDGTFGTSAQDPETGMVPDDAHPSSQAVWAAIPDFVAGEFPGRLHNYMPFEGDDYDAATNPTGNVLGPTTPSGTGGTAGTGGVATALYTGWAVERVTGSNAVITATQEELDDLGPVWQKLTMSGHTVDTEVVRAYANYSLPLIATIPAGTILDGLMEILIPRQKGLRRVAVRIRNGSGSGLIAAWDNETQGATASDMPEQEMRMLVPIEGFVVPAGLTSLTAQILLQARPGFSPSVYFRRFTLAPRGVG